jgi:glycosyltransferase involved in cell wall biosynthesis
MATRKIALKHHCAVLTIGPERSTQRNLGASRASGAYLLFVDSDMVLEPAVILECVTAARAGADAVIVPEVSFGDGFWAQCKRLERSCLRRRRRHRGRPLYTRDLFVRLNGFDELLRAGEDWGSQPASPRRRCDDRARLGLDPPRRRAPQAHRLARQEAPVRPVDAAYRRKHRQASRRQSRLVRPAFIRHRRALAAEPLTAAGCCS